MGIAETIARAHPLTARSHPAQTHLRTEGIREYQALVLGALARSQRAAGYDPSQQPPLRCSLPHSAQALDAWMSVPAVEDCWEMAEGDEPSEQEKARARAEASRSCAA